MSTVDSTLLTFFFFWLEELASMFVLCVCVYWVSLWVSVLVSVCMTIQT